MDGGGLLFTSHCETVGSGTDKSLRKLDLEDSRGEPVLHSLFQESEKKIFISLPVSASVPGAKALC